MTGTITLAAISSVRPASITKENRFCWTQPRHST
jgi:hypothetical protein